MRWIVDFIHLKWSDVIGQGSFVYVTIYVFISVFPMSVGDHCYDWEIIVNKNVTVL